MVKTKRIKCDDIAKPDKDKTIEVIENTKKYNNNDSKTCFWLYVSGLNGNPGEQDRNKDDLREILGCLRTIRPEVYDSIIIEAGKIINHRQ